MSDVVIRAEGLGKAYRIRHEAERRHDRFSEMLTERVSRLFRPGGEADATRETFWALRDVSFEIREGEVVGVIGRNGAGKSTLLKILSRITEPTEGRVEIRGRVASLLEVGTGFHPELTGRENIYLNGAILGMSRAEIRRKFDEIVDFAGVEKFLDTPVKRYSSGMSVRLAFAVAAHLEPEILVVDEVLAVGDAEFQRKCLGKMGEVAKGGRTVLFVSHNMGAVQALCPNTMLLNEGTLHAPVKTDNAISDYFLPDNLFHETTNKNHEHCEVKILEDAKPTCRINYGSDIAIQINIKTNKKIHRCMIGIKDQMNKKIIHLDSDIREEIKESQLKNIICNVQNMFLTPGMYYINVALVSRFGIEHWVEDISSFEVLPQKKDFGRKSNAEYGAFIPPHVWSTIDNQ